MEDFNNISNIVEEINCSLVESLTANDGNLNNGTSKKIMFFYNRTTGLPFQCFFLVDESFG